MPRGAALPGPSRFGGTLAGSLAAGNFILDVSCSSQYGLATPPRPPSPFEYEVMIADYSISGGQKGHELGCGVTLRFRNKHYEVQRIVNGSPAHKYNQLSGTTKNIDYHRNNQIKNGDLLLR